MSDHAVSSHSPNTPLQIIPACTGKAIHLSNGHSIKLINPHGTQVLDVWALSSSDPTELMSMAHTRAYLNKLSPSTGDTLVTQRRSPILTLTEDTSPGNHDTLMPACDRFRYARQYGIKEYHANCADNLIQALRELQGKAINETLLKQMESNPPGPFNVFMNVPVDVGGSLVWGAPTTKKGDWVVLRAEGMDVIVVISACPNDVMAINGGVCREASFQILQEGESNKR